MVPMSGSPVLTVVLGTNMTHIGRTMSQLVHSCVAGSARPTACNSRILSSPFLENKKDRFKIKTLSLNFTSHAKSPILVSFEQS